MNMVMKVDFGCVDYIMGSILLLTENGQFLWADNDTWGDKSKHHIEELKKESSWIQAEKSFGRLL